MRQHANRIKTELIARKGQQLTGQSPTICACGKSGMHKLADHMSITFMPSKGQDRRSLGFANSQARRDINPPERKLGIQRTIKICWHLKKRYNLALMRRKYLMLESIGSFMAICHRRVFFIPLIYNLPA